MQKIILFTIIVSIVLISGCATDNTKIVPYSPTEEPGANEIQNTEDIIFWAPSQLLSAAVVGEPYNYSFCDKEYTQNPVITKPSDICGDISNRADIGISGGNPPYHFQMGTGGGFPPMGMTLHPNGLLEGTPTVGGIYNFIVCVVDQAGTQVCGNYGDNAPTSLEVLDIKATIDSLACVKVKTETLDSHVYKYFKFTSKGTAKGDKEDSLSYSYDWKGVPKDIRVKIEPIKEESNCGSWELAESGEDYCANKNDATMTISWTFADSIILIDAGSVTFGVDAHIWDGNHQGHSTPVEKQVTCSG